MVHTRILEQSLAIEEKERNREKVLQCGSFRKLYVLLGRLKKLASRILALI